eukprot:Seg391.15 transcript_id=Seg391.15/GoldUCD/mRNA.D3Y31 product="von Willebrand factor A domain-containing protein 5A" protein_id=Seg391.15/GoldUCD/D3Y31
MEGTPKERVLSEDGDTSEEEIEAMNPELPFEIKYGSLFGKRKKLQASGVLDMAHASLKKINIKVHVKESVAEVSIEHKYFNSKRQSLRDACFFYAIGRECKIIAAKAYIDGKAIEEDIAKEIPAELDEIANHMETKLSLQEDPFQGRMLYKINISRIRPKSEAVIIIKYVTEAGLVEANGSTSLRIPTTLVADRSAPERFGFDNITLDDSDNPYVKVPMEIEVMGLMKGKVKYVSCSSHLIASLQENETDGKITMTAKLPGTDPTEIEEDFIVTFDWMELNKVEEQSTSLPLNILREKISDSESNCPLQSVKINGRLVNFIAEVTMELEYLNKGDCPIDIKRHHLPIEQGAAVVECTAKIDGHVIEMKVKDGPTAKQEAQDEGRSAILVEQLNPDTLGISLNGLEPNTKAIVTIKYVTELHVDGAVTRLMIPATIYPTVPLEVELLLVMEGRIKSISSPSHEVTSVKQGSFSGGTLIAKSRLAGETKWQTDRDFIAEIKCHYPKRPMVFVEKGKDGDDEDALVMVSIVPSFDLEKVPKEIIYLADMSPRTEEEGWNSSLGVIRNLIQSFNRKGNKSPEGISEGCFFNVIRFGKYSNPLFPNGSVAYNKETVDKAVGVIFTGKLDEMVGKDLKGALEHILKQEPKNGLPRQVILVTRNEIVDLEAILELIRQHTHNTQIFCYGMESVASKSVVRKIARAGRGTAFFASKDCPNAVTLLEKETYLLQRKGLNVLWKDSAGNTLSGWEHFPNIDTLESSSSISSPSHKGNRLSVIGKFPASRIPVSCNITSENTADCMSSKSTVSDVIEIPEDETLKFSTNSLHRFVGRKLIRELEKRKNDGQDVKERIVELALKYQLVSKFTSYIGK